MGLLEFALGFAFGWALMDLARYVWRRLRNKT
jgi:hypothetical protein